MKKNIQGIILGIEMLFEAVFAIGGIGATIDSKVNLHDGIFFSSIAILWFVISFLGIFELNDEKKWIIIPALGIKALIFLFIIGLWSIIGIEFIEFGVFFTLISIIPLILICKYKIKHMPKKTAKVYTQVNFNKYRFDSFRAKHHWNEAAMNEIGADKVTDENSDKIFILASTYFSYLLVWLLKKKLVNDSYISVFGDELKNIEAETVNPAQLFSECTEGNLLREDLTEEGQSFLDSYYYERDYKSKYSTSYETDYTEIVQNQNHLRIYHDFSWDIYHQFEKLLDERYKYYQIDMEFAGESENRTYDGSGEQIYSETFEQSIEIVAFSGVTDEYKDKCISHVKNMPKICYDMIYSKIDELWGFDEGTTTDTLRKDTYAMEIVIQKPYGDEIAYILEFEAEFEPEHGVSVMIRNDVVIDISIRADGYSPWDWESEINYKYETGGI